MSKLLAGIEKARAEQAAAPNSGKILYITDQLKVARGYEPAFTKMLAKSGIRRQEVICADIYNLVDQPLHRVGNEKLWRFNPEKLPQIKAAFDQRINSFRPKLIVVSDPAVMGVLVNGDQRLGTLDKCRGGVYEYNGITVIVTFPITAIHRNFDERLVEGQDADNKYEPYRIPSGNWILYRDWQKVGRFFHGKQRRLPGFTYSVCRTIQDCLAAKRFLLGCVLISCDIETGMYPAQITCIGYTGLAKDGTVRSFVFPFTDSSVEGGCFWSDPFDHSIAWSICAEINDSPVLKTMQNGSYDASYFIKYRIPIRNWLLDSMYLWFAMQMELPKSLDFISSILLDNYQYWKDDIKGKENESSKFNMETYWRYNALDCYNTLFNTIYMVKLLLNDPSMQHNYNDVFMRALSGLQMSMRGFKADFKRRDEHRVTLEAARDKAMDRIRFLIADPDFNPNSAPQKVSLLYDVLGAPMRNARGRYVDQKKPLKGQNAPSAGAIPLKLIKTEHPLFGRIIGALEAVMEPDKQISNVCNMKLFTDRFRTNFQPAGTETTRFSSKSSNFWDGGNAQNIRKTYRDWLVPEPNQVIFEVDYSQSDDVFVAYESEDPDKIAVVESGMDGHAVHGELFFGMAYEEIVAGKKRGDPLIVHPTTGVRQLAKRVVHGTNFQMAAMTLYTTMGRDSVVAAAILLGHKDANSWSQEKLVHLCGSLMLKYRKKYKRLSRKEWYGDIARALKTTGTLTNAFGVTRRFLGDADDNGTQREATAYIGQSDTSGNMNRSMYEVDLGYIPAMFRDGPNPHARERPLRMSYADDGFRFILQVHDSFVCQLDTTNPNWKRSAHNLLTVMQRPLIIKGRMVSIKTESELSMRWGTKKSIEWNGKDPYDLDRIYGDLTA